MATIEVDRASNETERNMNRHTTAKLLPKALAVVSTIALFSFVLFSSNTSTSVGVNTVNIDTSSTAKSTKFHQSGFGGIHNIAHPAGHRSRRFLEEEVVIPISAVKHAIPSLGRPNIQNLYAHYAHDEHKSPFSSHLYDRPAEELKKEQEEYEAKMNKVREEWGAWNFKDERDVVRPVANFRETEYKDMSNDKFPDNAWQTDETYVKAFIAEAKRLVDRMFEGIYAEYGHPTKKADGTMLTEDEIKTRNELFQVHISDTQVQPPGVSFINQAGMDALARKLLHGMMTNDEFYFVLGGHSAAAGHGNNFLQQKTMQFNHIMEPIFQKLGMRLISRNLAMGGLGTIHYSMGQAELYGETDFLMWDSMMTEKNPGDLDLFNKQAIINGERVPIIFTHSINSLKTETNDNIWYGDIIPGEGFIPLTTGIDQALTMPLATRYLRCDPQVEELCASRGNPNKYDAHCWVPRSDYSPVANPNTTFKSQASWHPGNRFHQAESRKAALTILHGLKNALQLWEEGMQNDGFPLKESYWHIGDTYKSVQDNLVSYMNGTGMGKSLCETRLETIGLARACRSGLHGMTQFTPINLSSSNSISAHMKAAPNGYVPKPSNAAYSEVNLLPLSWKIPAEEVDVHAIAIASTYKSPHIDHSRSGEDDKEEDVERRRRLRNNKMIVHKSSETEKNNQVTTNEQSPRTLSSNEVVPGLGWGIFTADDEITGYCDGSANSFDCKRASNNHCLLSGHNDGRSTISGDGLSGWLVIQIPNLKEGLVFARLEWWHPRSNWCITEGWTEENNGNRALGKPQGYPDDTEIDIAINGVIVETWSKADFEKMNEYVAIAYNEAFYKFFDDENFIKSDEGEPVEFGLRIRSETDPRAAGLSMSHLYYA